MKEDWSFKIEKKLEDISKGIYLIEKHVDDNEESTLLSSIKLKSYSDGKGKIEIYSVFPGINLSFHNYHAKQINFHHDSLDFILEINHCRHGRMGIEMMHGMNVYLGSGDLALQTMDCCANANITFPLEYYEGISITIDLNSIAQNPPEIIKEASISIPLLKEKLCSDGRPFAIPSTIKIQHIFSELYELPEAFKIPYFKLKVQELILFLSLIEPDIKKEISPYMSEQIELIKDIHNLLVSHPEQRFTIENLSKQYLINTTSLKTIFKSVYGLPIASYMKNSRIHLAARMLRETNDSISIIAKNVGYENQGKFTKAFKDILDVLPTEYRKQINQS